MTNSQRLETVRIAIASFLSKQTASSDSPMTESFLIREEFFCGRRFVTPTHRATWFVEQDELKIHETHGPLCLSIQGDQIDALAAEQRQASKEMESDHPSILPMPSFSNEDEDNREVRRAA